MKIEFDKPIDIYLFFVWTAILDLLILLNIKGIVRIIFGLPFVIFIPGYIFIFLLFPDQEIDIIERIALSFGLSIAIVPLIGLLLNYTPYGIRLTPIMVCLSGFVYIVGLLAIWRWYRLKEKERYKIAIYIDLPKDRVERVLTIALLVSILLSITLLIYIISTPRQGEKFTEFYILGPAGKAEGYPTHLKINENASIIIGIVNHEGKKLNYTVEIWLLQYSSFLSFNGNGYVKLPINMEKNFSIELWVKQNSNVSNQSYVSAKLGKKEFWLGWRLGRLVLAVGDEVIMAGCGNISEWHQMVVSKDSNRISLYVDGLFIGEIPEDSSYLKDVYLGVGLNGSIDNFRLYNRVLNNSEIKQNYEGNIVTYGLISWWKFNEGYGNITVDSVNGEKGVIYGGSWEYPENRTVEDSWFMGKIEVSLDSIPINIEKEWEPQWEYNYTFNIDKIGRFKLAFLLFMGKTGEFEIWKEYPEEVNRIDEAYRECHLWISVGEN